MSVYDLEYDIKSWKELLADLSKAKELIGRMKEQLSIAVKICCEANGGPDKSEECVRCEHKKLIAEAEEVLK